MCLPVQKFADYLKAASETSPEFSNVRDIIERFEVLASVHSSLRQNEEKTTEQMDRLRQRLQEYKRSQAAKILVCCCLSGKFPVLPVILSSVQAPRKTNQVTKNYFGGCRSGFVLWMFHAARQRLDFRAIFPPTFSLKLRDFLSGGKQQGSRVPARAGGSRKGNGCSNSQGR